MILPRRKGLGRAHSLSTNVAPIFTEGPLRILLSQSWTQIEGLSPATPYRKRIALFSLQASLSDRKTGQARALASILRECW